MSIDFIPGMRASSADRLTFLSPSALSSSDRFQTDIPASIPAGQAYYWSHVWRASEARARADLAAGRARTFTDPSDAVRYLLDV